MTKAVNSRKTSHLAAPGTAAARAALASRANQAGVYTVFFGSWSDIGGWLWLVIDVVLVAIFGAGIAYGMVMWQRRSRNPTLEQAREEATRRPYQSESDDEQHRPAP